MRKRTRILTGVLAGCLIMGQTVFAEEGELSFYNSGTDTATLRASQAELSNNEEISVNNLDAEQDNNTTYGISIQFINVNVEDKYYTYALKDNGEFWQIYPEMRVIGQNIKEANGNYVLANDGKVYNIFAMDIVIRENVIKLSNNAALTSDGVLWSISEDGEWSQIAENVKQIASGKGYLKNTGELCRWSNGSVIRENVEYLTDQGYYVTGEGFREFATSSLFGDLRVKQLGFRYHYNLNGKYTIYDLAITEDNEVWAAIGSAYMDGYTGELIKLGSDCVDLAVSGESWDWMDSRGNYYKWDQKVLPTSENPLVIGSDSTIDANYELKAKGDKADNYLCKNGEEVLTSVKSFVVLQDYAIALRNDGSIWDVTGTPVKIGTLNTGDDYIRGDITGDGSVQIDDLRMILRSVCGKVELTEQQKLAADVETDGEVNISDLRKVLRFVCGKIETL